ncbi:MAG TPA: biotin transporter BioY [Candidatus Nanoarchaeia archaeon]|nr:biotin transporter BioY [Candidatus Nanoarchaeia archaeon]
MKKKGTASKKGNSILKRSSNVLNIKGMVFAALFAALTAAVSPIKIPLGFTPVPITLQTMMVLLAGALLGSRLGALSQILYLAVGALGLPVFAGGSSGLGVLFGPTGGYLFSYPFAAFAVGFLIERIQKKTYGKFISPMIVGSLIIYVFGVIGGLLATDLPFIQILGGWVLPFLIGDFIKLLIAAAIALKFNMKRYLS